MMTQPLHILSAEQMNQWEKDGFIHLKGLIEPACIAAMNHMMEEIVDEIIQKYMVEGVITDDRKDLPYEKRLTILNMKAIEFGRSFRAVISRKGLYQLNNDPSLVKALRDVMGDEICGVPAYNARPNLPHNKVMTVPWHQDLGYYGAAAQQCNLITCWLPLVSVTEDMGAMQVIRGSHKWDFIPHFQGKNEGGFLETEELKNSEEDVITFVMEPGDVLMFNSFMMHRSVPNVSDKIRWSVDLRFAVPGEYQGKDGNLIFHTKNEKGEWVSREDHWIIASQNKPVTTEEDWLTWVQAWYGDQIHPTPNKKISG